MSLLRAMLTAGFTVGFGIAAGVTADNASYPIGFPDMPISKETAIAEAKRVHGECSRILALIPRLSPAEGQAIEAEIKAHRDMDSLTRRPEYARHVLYIHFYDCVNLSQIASAYTQTDKERIVAWTQLASDFAAAYELDDLADRASSPEIVGPIKRFAAYERTSTHQIIDGLVLPYLFHSN